MVRRRGGETVPLLRRKGNPPFQSSPGGCILSPSSARRNHGSKSVPAEADRNGAYMSHYDIVIKTIPAMLVAARRVTIPTTGHVPKYLELAFTETYDYLRRHGVQDNGPCFALWYNPGYVNEDAEALVPIDRPMAGTDRVKV